MLDDLNIDDIHHKCSKLRDLADVFLSEENSESAADCIELAKLGESMVEILQRMADLILRIPPLSERELKN